MVRDMFIGLINNYGYDKHELVSNVEDNFEYAGTDSRKGITYDCYLVPDGITYKAVCVEKTVDYEEAENKALADIDNYVADVCGGWL